MFVVHAKEIMCRFKIENKCLYFFSNNIFPQIKCLKSIEDRIFLNLCSVIALEKHILFVLMITYELLSKKSTFKK